MVGVWGLDSSNYRQTGRQKWKQTENNFSEQDKVTERDNELMDWERLGYKSAGKNWHDRPGRQLF